MDLPPSRSSRDSPRRSSTRFSLRRSFRGSLRGSLATERRSSAVDPLIEFEKKRNVKKELLLELISSTSVHCEINKSFVRALFNTGNSYTGWIEEDGFHGFGTYTFSTGASYRGSFENSLTKGVGKYVYPSGNVYEGAVLAGLQHGYGTFRTDTYTYVGYFKEGTFDGEGVWKSKCSELHGTFVKGRLTRGKLEDLDGLFEGTFTKNGCRSYGKFTYKNGDTYVGRWEDDTFGGFGVYTWGVENRLPKQEETKYVGFWRQGCRTGVGMLVYAQRCVVCEWVRNKQCGAGIIFACNGTCYASTELYLKGKYQSSFRISLCDDSKRLLRDIIQVVTNPEVDNTKKRTALRDTIRQLFEKYAECSCAFCPIRIPQHEIYTLEFLEYGNETELKFVQQVILENCIELKNMYCRYVHPTEQYMNRLSLNLFYMDVFFQVQDISIPQVMDKAIAEIGHLCLYSDISYCMNPLTPVSFNQFLNHFLRTVAIYMENEEVLSTVKAHRPTFFGLFSTGLLIALKMFKTREPPPFIAREALQSYRSEIAQMADEIKKMAFGDYSIRTAYRYLRQKCMVTENSSNFIQALTKQFENVYQSGILYDSETQFSILELIELILQSSKLKIASQMKV